MCPTCVLDDPCAPSRFFHGATKPHGESPTGISCLPSPKELMDFSPTAPSAAQVPSADCVLYQACPTCFEGNVSKYQKVRPACYLVTSARILGIPLSCRPSLVDVAPRIHPLLITTSTKVMSWDPTLTPSTHSAALSQRGVLPVLL